MAITYSYIVVFVIFLDTRQVAVKLILIENAVLKTGSIPYDIILT